MAIQTNIKANKTVTFTQDEKLRIDSALTKAEKIFNKDEPMIPKLIFKAKSQT